MVRKIKAAFAALLIAASAALPAFGTVVVNSGNTGYSFTVDFVGQVNSQTTPSLSALQIFTFDGVTNGGLTYNFSYSLFNDSQVDSRIRSFGFNTSGDVTALSATGDYAFAQEDGQFPEGLGTLDLCFRATGNGQCNGGQGGLESNPDELGGGSFALTFANVMESLTFDTFAVRFQSVDPVTGGTSGIGNGTVVNTSGGGGGGGGEVILAPEPGTWLMMIGGFGLIGFAMRRRSPAIGGLARAG